MYARFLSFPALILLPVSLFGQDTTSTPFHRGQWAVQFGVTSGLVSLGIMRFTSPRSAWLLLFDGNAEFLDGKRTDPFGTTSDAKDRSVFFAVGVGKRFYQASVRKVRSFQSIGIAGSYEDRKQTFGASSFTTTRWSAGLLGELGAAYWVTQNLSLGGTGTASAGYSHRLSDNSGDRIRENGVFVSGVSVRLVVGLYF